MSMTLAARASHIHHVSARAPARAQSVQLMPNLTPLVWFRRKFKARPGTTLAHCAFAIAACIILTNALALQRQDSPRSFIGEQAASQAASQSRAAQAPAAIPLPPTRPVELSQGPVRSQAAAQSSASATATSAVLRPPPPVAAREPQAARDPIGDLIRSGQVSAAPQVADPVRGAVAKPAAETRPVAAAQRALNRLGVGPVKADGVFGEETRAAIERFERDRRIPVTRDLSPRTLRELTAASGIRME